MLGACRREELAHMSITDVELYFSDRDRLKMYPMMLVNIPFSKNGDARSFIIKGEFYKIVKLYANLHPKGLDHQRFFVNYQNGQCTKQPVGINKMGTVPNTMATFLGLENPKRYTSHAIRHTGASLFVEGGGDVEDLKRLGGWKSNGVAVSYVTHSKSSKEKICDKITSNIILPSTSSEPTASTSSANPCSTKGIVGANSESGAAHSSANLHSMKNIAGPSSRATSTKSSISTSAGVPASTKENLVPITNQAVNPKLKLKIKNCTGCTFHFSDKKN